MHQIIWRWYKNILLFLELEPSPILPIPSLRFVPKYFDLLSLVIPAGELAWHRNQITCHMEMFARPNFHHPSNNNLPITSKMPITPQMLNAKREEGCFAITADRKYYHVGNTFIKRSLRPSEWQTNPLKGTLHIPRQGRERILNEAAAMRYIAMTTDIPVPRLYCSFEDDGAAYLVMEYIEGDSMAALNDDQRSIVQQELDLHVNTLHKLRSKVIGGPSGLVSPVQPLFILTASLIQSYRSSLLTVSLGKLQEKSGS